MNDCDYVQVASASLDDYSITKLNVKTEGIEIPIEVRALYTFNSIVQHEQQLSLAQLLETNKHYHRNHTVDCPEFSCEFSKMKKYLLDKFKRKAGDLTSSHYCCISTSTTGSQKALDLVESEFSSMNPHAQDISAGFKKRDSEIRVTDGFKCCDLTFEENWEEIVNVPIERLVIIDDVVDCGRTAACVTRSLYKKGLFTKKFSVFLLVLYSMVRCFNPTCYVAGECPKPTYI